MNNALSYLNWRGDLSFDASPFNEVDLFLCSQLSTIDFAKEFDYDEGRVELKKAAKKYFATTNLKKEYALGTLQSESVLPMLEKIIETERFKDITIWNPETNISKEDELQFSAVTLVFPNNCIVVSYRGTDDTIIGWKEDCNIAAYEQVPAQKMAQSYLEEVAKHFPNATIYMCGHSKGGNLAVYASSYVIEEIQKRIDYVVNFDGPGFQESFFENDGYKRIKNSIYTVISKNSIVGLLLKQAGTLVCVETSVKGPNAHDGFNWEVMGTQFVRCDSLSPTSKTIKAVIDETLGEMDTDERLTFINELFGEILATGKDTVTDLVNMTTSEKYNLCVKLLSNHVVGKFMAAISENVFKEIFPADFTETAEYIGELIEQGKKSWNAIQKMTNGKKYRKKQNNTENTVERG